MNPGSAMARIGDAFWVLNDFDQANLNYRRTLVHGYNKYAYLGMAKIYAQRNQMGKATEILIMLLDKESQDVRIKSETATLIRSYPQLATTLPRE